jgi:hypothetical protein
MMEKRMSVLHAGQFKIWSRMFCGAATPLFRGSFGEKRAWLRKRRPGKLSSQWSEAKL